MRVASLSKEAVVRHYSDKASLKVSTKGTLHGCIKEDAILSKVKVCSTAIIDYNQYATMPGSAVVPCMEYSGIAGAGVRGN